MDPAWKRSVLGWPNVATRRWKTTSRKTKGFSSDPVCVFFWTFFATRGESSMPQVSSLQNLNMKGANNIKRLLIYYVSESWRVQQEIVFWHSWITFWCGFCFHVATVCNWVNHEANLWPRGWGWQWPGITPMNYTCIHVQFGSQICLLQHVCFPLFVEQGAFGTNVSKFCWWSPIWFWFEV